MTLREELYNTAATVKQKRESERASYLVNLCRRAAKDSEFGTKIKAHTFDDGTELTQGDVQLFAMVYDMECELKNIESPYIAYLSWDQV